jgi:hypothetical protein
MLTAYFAVMYYAGLRPEEAAMLRKQDLQLPENGWGELLLSETAPVAGAAWTDSGERRDRRQLKQRGRGEVRHVPSPPPLVAGWGSAVDAGRRVAGHSVAVLHQIYAKVIAGQEDSARRRIETAPGAAG